MRLASLDTVPFVVWSQAAELGMDRAGGGPEGQEHQRRDAV